MIALLDTNILLRYANPASPEHTAVASKLEAITRAGDLCAVCSQTLVELWAVVTRPVAANGMGLPASEARLRINALCRSFAFVGDPPSLFTTWLDLCTSHEVQGRQAYDARLVALMVAAGIERLVTLNPIDFARYKDVIDVSVPGA